MKQPATHAPAPLHTFPLPHGVPAAAPEQAPPPLEPPEVELDEDDDEEEEEDDVEPLAGEEALRDEEETVPLDEEEATPLEDEPAPPLLLLEENWDAPQSWPPQWPLLHV